jgi:hypothetical protein
VLTPELENIKCVMQKRNKERHKSKEKAVAVTPNKGKPGKGSSSKGGSSKSAPKKAKT